ASEHDEDHAEHAGLAVDGVTEFDFHLICWATLFDATRNGDTDDCQASDHDRKHKILQRATAFAGVFRFFAATRFR
ncbi:MAG: hypothetical protein ACKO6O_06550, partial [Acidimicrobiaceae bacterium]